MSQVVTIGLIGCGGIAGRHIQWFLDCPDCQITAVCDVSPEAMKGRSEEIHRLQPGCRIRQTTDYEELVRMPDLDAVAVLLPHTLHFPAVMAALEADKHVLVEKPMVTETDHAHALIRTAAQRGKLIGIGYQRSYISEYAYVRRMVESGELGEIRLVSAHLEQSWYANFLSTKGRDPWRKRPEDAGGGQLVDCGSHTIAALLDVTQLVPNEVFAFIENCDVPVDINTAAAVRFTNGAVGTLCIGGFGHSVTEVLRVVGDKRSARIFFRTVREQSLEIDGKPVDAKTELPGSAPNANFVDAILGKDRIRADAELGLHVAQLSDAIYRSAAEHGAVQVERKSLDKLSG
jgi:predicted dehydrogenase